MACNTCAKPFSLFRKEKGCPGCGFSYCSKCLDSKLFLAKLNSEAKVCSKCKRSTDTVDKKNVEPPDAFYKFQTNMSNDESNKDNDDKRGNDSEEEISKRLQKLKKDKIDEGKVVTDDEILKRLQGIKGNQPTTSDAELQLRLANLKGLPAVGIQDKQVLCARDTRTEQEQANDLMKQYMEQTNIDTQYQEGFNQQIDDIEARLQKLRGTPAPAGSKNVVESEDIESEDEETAIKTIIEKAKAEQSLLADDDIPSNNEELPFCEICNEDATMRCLGCRYLFCKQCFLEHKDDDDDCNRYEPYKPPKKL